MCIDIVEIWFWIANEKISSFYDELSVRDTSIFSFPDDNLSKWIFIKNLVCALILWRSASRLLMGNFSARDTSIFLFPNTSFSKSQWIFTKRYVH